jgi:hypothetical protein
MMTQDDLKALFEAREAAKDRFDRYAMSNTAGLSAEQRVDLDIRYHQARDAYWAAMTAYDAALRDYRE